jgi:hypothetical protein
MLTKFMDFTILKFLKDFPCSILSTLKFSQKENCLSVCQIVAKKNNNNIRGQKYLITISIDTNPTIILWWFVHGAKFKCLITSQFQQNWTNVTLGLQELKNDISTTFFNLTLISIMTNGTKNIFRYPNTLVDLTLIILFSSILKIFKKELFERTIF